MSFYNETSLAELKNRANEGDWDAAQTLDAVYTYPETFPHPEVSESDLREATKWAEHAKNLIRQAAEAGDKVAMFHFGMNLSTGPFMSLYGKAAFHWMLKSAEAGYPQACKVLSLAMADKNNPHYNLAEALKWAVKTAWSDPAHVFDEWLPTILKEIRKLSEEVNGYLMSAEGGDAEAQFQMGHIFHTGYGVDADTDAAREWWSKAAEQGHERAQQMLSSMEENHEISEA